jgi:putative flavoprotein involved in K+ transport
MLARTPDQELSAWLIAFDAAMSRRDFEAAANLFLPDAFWRDLVAFTWNVHTAEGQKSIRHLLTSCVARTAPTSWQPAEPARLTGDTIEGMAVFETAVARCSAVIRIKDGKCWTLLTAITELKGGAECVRQRRPHGTPFSYSIGRKTWRRQRDEEAQELGTTREPYCVIVGAGHCGLSLAARLGRLDVPTLVIERRERGSDTWRSRHESLSLHSPSWFDTMPYFPYPESWPLYPSKDQFADWLDAYRTVMDIDVWNGAECRGADFDETRQEWRLSIARGGRTVELRPKQLVLANGLFSTPKLPDIPGMRGFKGEQHHADDPRSGDYAGRRCVVVGSGSTAHDICAEMWEAGADVTMIQRSPTIVMRQERLVAAVGQLYGDDAQARGITTEVADLLSASLPQRMALDMHRQLVAEVEEKDADFYEKLQAAGFLLTFGEHGGGILPQILRNPSGYYIDVGASELIADGRVKIRSGVGLEALGERSVLLSDGSELPADVVVYATGYELGAAGGGILPHEMARKVGRIWGLGSGTKNDPGPWEGELRNMFKPTQQAGLWFHSHGISGSRFYSRILALQIKARQLGLPTPVYKLADGHHRE